MCRKDTRTDSNLTIAALGRIYGFRHLLSLERIRYYIQVFDKCQYLNIIFRNFFQNYEVDSCRAVNVLAEIRSA